MHLKQQRVIEQTQNERLRRTHEKKDLMIEAIGNNLESVISLFGNVELMRKQNNLQLAEAMKSVETSHNGMI